MKAKNAIFIFLAVCVVLALLLLAGAISPTVSGAIFAVALAVLGGFSRGFRNR
jgi:uncharacterized membrane protein YfbV (UPF0208 family)